jgi:hypothetical protein
MTFIDAIDRFLSRIERAKSSLPMLVLVGTVLAVLVGAGVALTKLGEVVLE